MARPNIVFTIADDQRHSAVGALGLEPVHTPALDALADRGTALTRACIMGSTVPAVCAPSRAMLHTGRSLFHLPGEADDLATPHGQAPRTLARALRDAGYHTHGVGKWHNGKRTFADGFASGGRIMFGGMSDHRRVPLHDFDPAGVYPDAASYTGEGFSTDLFADAACDFLERYHADAPFFLYAAFTAPHDPRTPRPRFAQLYDPASVELPPNFLPEHPFDNGELDIRDEQLAPRPRDPQRTRREIADYRAMVSDLDQGVGSIHAALARGGLLDNTLVIHTADHGLAVGQHGLLGKQNLYDPSVRVPLILAGPGVPAGQRRGGLCYMADLGPTLVDRAGAKPVGDGTWRSLEPLIAGRPDAGRDEIFAAYRGCQRMVRDQRFKLITYTLPADRRTQLFDLHADPWETSDLAAQPGYADHVQRLGEALGRWQVALGDPQVPGDGSEVGYNRRLDV